MPPFSVSQAVHEEWTGTAGRCKLLHNVGNYLLIDIAEHIK